MSLPPSLQELWQGIHPDDQARLLGLADAILGNLAAYPGIGSRAEREHRDADKLRLAAELAAAILSVPLERRTGQPQSDRIQPATLSLLRQLIDQHGAERLTRAIQDLAT